MNKKIIITLVFFTGIFVGKLTRKVDEPKNVAYLKNALITVEQPKIRSIEELNAWARSVYKQI